MSIKYKSPIKNKEFNHYWERFIPVISEKDGFDESCLKNVEIICSLYVTFDELSTYLTENSLIIENHTRYGLQVKPNPALGERAKVVAEIRHYSKLLGMKISPTPQEEDGLHDEWQ